MADKHHPKESLVEMINNLPTKGKIAKELADITLTDNSTVYRWMTGKITPPPLKQAVIAKYFNRPVEELFPE